jgi:hypothetical protein
LRAGKLDGHSRTSVAEMVTLSSYRVGRVLSIGGLW